MSGTTFATYGLKVRSELDLAPFPRTEDGPVDVEIVLEPGVPSAVGTIVAERWTVNEAEPYLRTTRTERGYVLDHVDGLVLELTEGGKRIAVRHVSPQLDAAARTHILLDQLLPLVFAHLGRLSFHGSAVAIDERALCFLADSRTGKSTLAAALARHGGAHFLADDEVVLEESADGHDVHPSYPTVRLWNESARALFEAEGKPRGKHHVPLPSRATAVPLASMVLLERAPSTQLAPVEIERLGPRDGMMGIATHVDRLDPTDRAALRREIEALARLAERTPIVRMRVARDLTRLPEVAAYLRGWCGGFGDQHA